MKNQVLPGVPFGIASESLHRFSVLLRAVVLLLAIYTLPGAQLLAQTAIGGNTPDNSAMLDVQGTTKGVLFPRLTTTERNAIASPSMGLMIFNTTTRCLEINLGSGTAFWQSIKCVSCGAYVAAGVWKEFSCYNLGVANTSADPFTPSWEIIGGYWQWGIQAQAAPGPTGTNGSTPNDDIPSSWTPAGTTWNTTSAADGSWADAPAAKGANDPCPSGFRVPSKTDWEGVLNPALNPPTNVGNWTAGSTNYSSGKLFGPGLFLPAAGYRDNNTGTLSNRGSLGYYWSSTVSGSANAWYLFFLSGGAGMDYGYRPNGQSLRCVAE